MATTAGQSRANTGPTLLVIKWVYVTVTTQQPSSAGLANGISTAGSSAQQLTATGAASVMGHCHAAVGTPTAPSSTSRLSSRLATRRSNGGDEGSIRRQKYAAGGNGSANAPPAPTVRPVPDFKKAEPACGGAPMVQPKTATRFSRTGRSALWFLKTSQTATAECRAYPTSCGKPYYRRRF